MSEHEYDESLNIARKLRDNGHSTTIVFTSKKLSDKLTYASKIAKNGIVIGAEEVASHAYKSKNFQTGETTDLHIGVISKPEDFWSDEE